MQAGPSKCGAQCRPALAGAGPKANPKRGAPLSSGFMTSLCLRPFYEDVLVE